MSSKRKRTNPQLQALEDWNLKLRGNSTKLYVDILADTIRGSKVPFKSEALVFLERRDFCSLLEWAESLSSHVYDDAGSFFSAIQIAALIRKYPFSKTELNLDPRAKATETFLASEQQCSETNVRLSDPEYYPGLLHQVRAVCYNVLGEDVPLDTIYGLASFSGGASIGTHGNATHLGRKLLDGKLTVSPGALPYARIAFRKNFHLSKLVQTCFESDEAIQEPKTFNRVFDANVNLIDYNKISFVPKTARTDRTIAVEPVLNGFIQKGIDLFMRARLLRKLGLDLRRQDINSQMARLGSFDDTDDPFCTIDLSSASDSISTRLVERVLPSTWFDFLNSVRAKNFLLSGNKTRYQKFCSMGNGFCFPLETLIFSAVCIASGCKPRDWRTYGDDIIVRRSKFDIVIENLRILGFTPNTRKTFSSGPFRESCGGNFYKGKDVTPLTLDYRLDSFQALAKFCNLVFRNPLWAMSLGHVRRRILSLIPRKLRFFRIIAGPEESAFEVERDLFMMAPYIRWNREIWSWEWKELVMKGKNDTRFWRVGSSTGHYSDMVMIQALLGNPENSLFPLRRETRTSVGWFPRKGALYAPSDHLVVSK